MAKKTYPDSTGLDRTYQSGNGGQIHLKLQDAIVHLAPQFVQRLSPAPGGLNSATLHTSLMQTLDIPPEVYGPAQQFVREYGENLVEGWGSNLIIMGIADQWVRRIIAAGTINEIIRIYHHRADVSAAWIHPRSFESLYLGYNKDKMDSIYGQFTRAKIAVFDSLNLAMQDSRASVEEVLMDRVTHKLPSVLIMNTESPLFSEDLADELTSPHHYRALFKKSL